MRSHSKKQPRRRAKDGAGTSTGKEMGSSEVNNTNDCQRRMDGGDSDNSNEREPNTNGSDDGNAVQDSLHQSWWQLLRTHPTFLALIFLVIPWLMNSQTKNIYLRYPHHINRILDLLDQTGMYSTEYRLRPALGMNETRQLLIVGSMSSGTTQVTHDLVDLLGLEVGHEDSDTTWYPVRDGTVSWFHGIRFLNRTTDPQERMRTLVDICKVSWRIYSSDKIQWNHPWSNYGSELVLFGPTSFSKPHFHPSFKEAYLQTCQQTIFQELGCELTKSCKGAPFQKFLLQTRHPWRIVTSLVTKYCGGGEREAPKTLRMLFQALYPSKSRVWFPEESSHQIANPKDADRTLKHCADQMGLYVSLWYRDMLDSFGKLREIDEGSSTVHIKAASNYRIYPIESTTICQVAAMAGLDVDANSGDDIVYQPNMERVAEFCQKNPNTLFGNTQNQFNSKNNANETVETLSSRGSSEVDSSVQEQKLDVSTVRFAMNDDIAGTIDRLARILGYHV